MGSEIVPSRQAAAPARMGGSNRQGRRLRDRAGRKVNGNYSGLALTKALPSRQPQDTRSAQEGAADERHRAHPNRFAHDFEGMHAIAIRATRSLGAIGTATKSGCAILSIAAERSADDGRVATCER